jgi:beta-lactamase regulating signal transducer with metallopeptidase domain
VVSMIALGPWPRWWTFTVGQAGHSIEAGPREKPTSNQALRFREADELASAPGVAGEIKPFVSPPRNETAAASAWMSRLLSELRRPTVNRKQPRWSWPEWVALGFFASFGLGLARLALGVWSIHRLRAQSLLIEDTDLLDAVAILRAELSCSRKVEVRETSELTTPATIGWRRPLLLLPCEWRCWTEAERRIVLAHELAHVCRGDYLTGLVAQASLTLHFYNPVVHWLARRLRLEQELAADAWAASLVGGKQAYLMTLAQMALRRDSRALTWPARAFLPSRGTFVRRIEMLRNTSRIRHAPLPAVARLLTVGVLSVLGLLVAGLRGPAGLSAAQTQPQEPVAAGAQTTPNESYNLAFLPADAKLVIALRPHALLERREMRTLLESIKQTLAFKGVLAVPPEDVEQLLVFWEGIPQAPAESGRTPPSGGVLRTSKPQEWKSLLKNQQLGSALEVRHDGQTYLCFGGANAERWGAFVPDDRTLVFAREDLLRELIEDRKSPVPRHPWDEAWNKVVKGQVMVALETRWLRRRIAQGLLGVPPAPGQASNADLKLETISPLLDKARSYAIAIDAARGLTVDLVAVAGAPDDAKPVANTLQALLTLGKNAVQGMRQDLRNKNSMHGEAMDWIVEAADSLLSAASLDTAGGYVHLQAKSSIDLAGGVRLLVPAVAAANTASHRKLSVNNLKQIALAFHNFHAANNHFPTSVLNGGATGKVPYSWRVAILPYLEQNDLYKRYDFDEPWDGPNNRKLLDLMPAVYNSYPGIDGSPASRTNTAYFVFSGEAAALGLAVRGQVSANPTIADFLDGTSNTILAVESKREVPWTKPEDIPFDIKGPPPELQGFWEKGFNAAFADGSVRFISKAVNPTVLKALITRAGGEVLRTDDF